MLRGLTKLAATALAFGALAASPLAQAEIVALRADGTAAYIHDPATGQIVSTLTPDGDALWAGVVAFDVDPGLPGDELIFTRQLGQDAGAGGGFEVYSHQAGSSRLGGALGNLHYRAVTRASVLDGGTRGGLAALRPDLSSGGKGVFELWDPAALLGGGGRVEFHLGYQTNGDWDSDVIVAADLSADTPGDEIAVLRTSGTRTLVEFYGRTGASGHASYTRIHASNMTRPVETFTIAQGILPGGEDTFVFLREDGRISFWTTAFMTDDDHTTHRLVFTPADSGYENFIRVADVLDSHPGQELIVGYHDPVSGVRGYRVLGLPTDYTGGHNTQVTLPVLGTYDLGGEIRDIDLLAIPEPATMGLLANGLLLALRRPR